MQKMEDDSLFKLITSIYTSLIIYFSIWLPSKQCESPAEECKLPASLEAYPTRLA